MTGRTRALRTLAKVRRVGALSLVVGLRTQLLRAADEEPLRVHFRSAPGCPNEASFFQELRDRTDKFRRVEDGSTVRIFRVNVQPNQRNFSGRLEVRSADGHETSRSVDGETCAQVVSALSVMVALAIDPDANIQALPTPAKSISKAPPPLRDNRTTARSSDTRIDAGLQGLVNVLSAPGLAWGSAITISVRSPDSIFAHPELHVALEWLPNSEISESWGSVKFSELAGRIEFCSGIDVSPRWRLAGCPLIRFARTSAEATGFTDAKTRQVSRWDAGLSARGSWSWTRLFSLDVEIQGIAPLNRHSFLLVDPETRVYTTRSVGVVFALGLFVRFL